MSRLEWAESALPWRDFSRKLKYSNLEEEMEGL